MTAANQPAAMPEQVIVVYDFRVPGVIIWSEPDTGPNSIRSGLGYPNQLFNCDKGTFDGGPYTCDNGVTTSTWRHGTDAATGITGWVPDCNLVAPPQPSETEQGDSGELKS